MVCIECKQPLHIISGGNKTEVNTTDIITVHVFGCMNRDCKERMKEQDRTETKNPSFMG